MPLYIDRAVASFCAPGAASLPSSPGLDPAASLPLEVFSSRTECDSVSVVNLEFKLSIRINQDDIMITLTARTTLTAIIVSFTTALWLSLLLTIGIQGLRLDLFPVSFIICVVVIVFLFLRKRRSSMSQPFRCVSKSCNRQYKPLLS